MKKIIKLTESDLTRIVKRILNEQDSMQQSDDNTSGPKWRDVGLNVTEFKNCADLATARQGMGAENQKVLELNGAVTIVYDKNTNKPINVSVDKKPYCKP